MKELIATSYIIGSKAIFQIFSLNRTWDTMVVMKFQENNNEQNSLYIKLTLPVNHFVKIKKNKKISINFNSNCFRKNDR